MEFKFLPITNSKQLGPKRALSSIRYIVIHDTGNPGAGAGAMAHYKYLQGATRPGSAQYYIDDKMIVQTIGDSRTAWAVGDKWGYKNNPNRIREAKNVNTLSLELCINRDCDPAKAYKNLVELTKNLMVKFKVPADCVIRHFDVTGKTCPGSWSAQNWAKWWQFKEDIKGPIDWVIDLSKDSSFGPGVTKKEDKPMTSWGDEEFKKAVDLGITDGTNPDNPATRKEVACMIVRALSQPAITKELAGKLAQSLTDVKKNL